MKDPDFGLAKVTSNTGDGETLTVATAAGLVYGTAGYISPEQLRGLAADHVRTSSRSARCVNELFSGQRVFQNGSMIETMSATLQAIRRRWRRAVPRCRRRWRRVVRRCLAKEPGARFQSAKDVVVDAGGDRSPIRKSGRCAAADSPAHGVDLRRAARGCRDWLAGAGPVDPRALACGTGDLDSIAVLPLANLSGNAEEEYFADGMTDALITGLSKIGGFRRVISRTSVISYKGTRKSMPEIGTALGVESVVEGTVLRSGGRVRIAVQLVRAATEQPLWAETYERDLRDVLSLQGEVAGAIAQEDLARGVAAGSLPARRGPVDPDAHVAYLKGRYDLARLTRQDIDAAIADFNEAIRRDPKSALPYAGLSDAYAALRSMYCRPTR